MQLNRQAEVNWALARVLQHEDVWTAVDAGKALKKWGTRDNPQAVQDALNMVRPHDEQHFRKKMIEVLGALKESRSVDPLINKIKFDPKLRNKGFGMPFARSGSRRTCSRGVAERGRQGDPIRCLHYLTDIGAPNSVPALPKVVDASAAGKDTFTRRVNREARTTITAISLKK